MPNNSNSGQVDFTGGMRLDRRPLQNEYSYCENMILRNGFPETRPGIQRLTRVNQQLSDTTFYFGDKTIPSGFWFPFSFSNIPQIGDIVGYGDFRFDGMDVGEAIITTDGTVLTNLSSKNIEIPVSEDISGDTSNSFIDGNNEVLLLRGIEDPILIWRKSDIESGFVELTGTLIPKATIGAYAFNRTWLASGSELHASDPLESDYYNTISQSFDINPGDGEDITAIAEFKDEYLLVFKQTKTYVLSGVNSPIDSVAGKGLADYVTIDRVSKNIGCVNQNSVVVKGEQVYFMSEIGMSSLSRTQEGNIYGADFLISDPIKPIIDTINFNSNRMCATYFDNYLLFSVPTYSETNPNIILVFDMKMGERGSWVSVWKSAVELPLSFYKMDNDTKLVGLCSDGVVRLLFNDDPWDSEDLSEDMVEYDPLRLYPEGDFCKNPDNNGIYVALRETIGDYPSTSPDDWEYMAVQESVYNIRTEFNTYVYGDVTEQVPKKHNRMEVDFIQQDSNVSLFTFNHGMSSLKSIFEDLRPVYTEYKVVGLSFVNTNENLDYNDEHRKDYTMFIPEPDGFYIPVEGVDITAWTKEAIRFTYLGVDDYGVGLRLVNTSGKIRIHSILFIFTTKRFAGKGR